MIRSAAVQFPISPPGCNRACRHRNNPPRSKYRQGPRSGGTFFLPPRSYCWWPRSGSVPSCSIPTPTLHPQVRFRLRRPFCLKPSALRQSRSRCRLWQWLNPSLPRPGSALKIGFRKQPRQLVAAGAPQSTGGSDRGQIMFVWLLTRRLA